MPTISDRLRTLQAKAVEKGQWPLACALEKALSDDCNVDHRINVIGAMHEVGLLRNSLQPLWTTWRFSADGPAWARRCLERLLSSDHDYWAVAGLLGLSLSVLKTALSHSSVRLLSIRLAHSYKANDRHIAVLGVNHSDRVISPVLEVGWDTVTAEVVDMARWRAVVLERQEIQGANLIGHGSGSYFLRANLPYGSWRIVDDTFCLGAESSIPHEKTLFADYQ
jgi:hypothetical protein